MEAAQPLPVGTSESKSSFGTASLVFAALTVLLPVAVALFTGHELNHNEEANKNGGWGRFAFVLFGVMAAVAAAGISSLVGTVAGIAALARREGDRWRPVVGLIVNVPVLLFVLYLVVVTWHSGN